MLNIKLKLNGKNENLDTNIFRLLTVNTYGIV